MAEAFQLGDVVRLKSGGPAMTVHGDSYGNVICVWFVGTERKSGEFAPTSIILHEEPAAKLQVPDSLNQ